MTPAKEKAQELFDKFTILNTVEINGVVDTYKFLGKPHALIAVDELIGLAKFFKDNEGTCFEMDDYYEQVKECLNKM
jgi:hypothetical protein